MASQEMNRVRQAFGLEPQPAFIVDLPYDNPETVEELAANDKARIHNMIELGTVTQEEGCELLDAVEKMSIGVGDGWFDRYGVPSAELADIYPEAEKYWEKPVGER
jgi:hypothetical protein